MITPQRTHLEGQLQEAGPLGGFADEGWGRHRQEGATLLRVATPLWVATHLRGGLLSAWGVEGACSLLRTLEQHLHNTPYQNMPTADPAWWPVECVAWNAPFSSMYNGAAKQPCSRCLHAYVTGAKHSHMLVTRQSVVTSSFFPIACRNCEIDCTDMSDVASNLQGCT